MKVSVVSSVCLVSTILLSTVGTASSSLVGSIRAAAASRNTNNDTLLSSLYSANARKNKNHEKVLVFVLAGQSNMEGHGEVNTTNTTTSKLLNGTLMYQLLDPRTRDEFGVLWDSSKSNWNVWKNIKMWFNEAGTEMGNNGSKIPGIPNQDYSAGDLTVGYGTGGPVGNGNNFIGPELGFGIGLGFPKDQRVLIIKTAWGGKSIAHDFRPPSSTRMANGDPYCQPPDCDPTQVGHYYQMMIQNVNRIMAPGVIGEMYPDLANLDPEIAGFGWFQGWNDGCSLNDTAAYETNMVNLIQDLREEWNAPHLPVNIALSGFDGFTNVESKRQPQDCWDGPNASKINCDCGPQDHGCRRIDIVLSQFGAANLTRHPELECCVVASETRGFWREAEYSPNKNQGYHFYHNAETHFLVGKAMGRAMVKAISEQQNYIWKKEKMISTDSTIHQVEK
mmetsp:Transcript_6474/g.9845  ORF Transcript_6474/g.9845 Transcript_6474/m.9845 type:complete len:448 (+) Transcript_6474:102-1445(+)